MLILLFISYHLFITYYPVIQSCGLKDAIKHRFSYTCNLATCCFPIYATEDMPIVFSISRPEFRMGRNISVGVYFYNKDEKANLWKKDIQLDANSCTSEDYDCCSINEVNLIYHDKPIHLDKSEDTGLLLKITTPNGFKMSKRYKECIINVRFCGIDSSKISDDFDCNTEGVLILNRNLLLRIWR